MPVLLQARTVGQLVTRKAIEATQEEAVSNPRSRSAKLRVFEKLAHGQPSEAAEGGTEQTTGSPQEAQGTVQQQAGAGISKYRQRKARQAQQVVVDEPQSTGAVQMTLTPEAHAAWRAASSVR